MKSEIKLPWFSEAINANNYVFSKNSILGLIFKDYWNELTDILKKAKILESFAIYQWSSWFSGRLRLTSMLWKQHYFSPMQWPGSFP